MAFIPSDRHSGNSLVRLKGAGVRSKSMTTLGSGELHEKLFHYPQAGTLLLSSMDL